MDDTKIIPRTVASVFDHVKIYSEGYTSAFCIASKISFNNTAEREQSILSQLSPNDRQGMLSWDTATLKYLGDRDYIMQKTDRFPINDDLKPYCEYYLGLIKKYKHSFKM